ncbi:Pentatricopeptide repeat-containing protein [Hirschfeldia incana]|nr:Pentatricopeptide repeat-containing protein [Hirschfeldia incana]
MALLPAIGIPSPAPPQQTPFISRNNHANPKIHQLNQSAHETTVSWTSRITLLSRNGRLAEAAKEFTAMRLAGVEPNHITLIALLSGCSDSEPLGDSLHGYACKLGLDRNHVMVGTAILGIAHVETAYIREVLELISSDSRLQCSVVETLVGDHIGD